MSPPSAGLTARDLRQLGRSAVRNTAPIRQVMQTAELLECVLMHLDMRTLLVSAQLTCRAWRNLVSTSSTLQEALFFRPESGSEGGSGGEVRKNPVLSSAFPAWFVDHSIADPNPSRPNHRTVAPIPSVSEIPHYLSFSSQPFGRRVETFMRPRASWRRMLIQQPPAYGLGQWTTTRSWTSTYSASATNYKDGVRMGHIYDLTTHLLLDSSDLTPMCLLWGETGIAQLLASASTRAPEEDLLANFRPQIPGAREAVEEMMQRADVVIAVANFQSCEVGNVKAELRAFIQEFKYRGGKNGIGPRRDLPMGKRAWEGSVTEWDEVEDL